MRSVPCLSLAILSLLTAHAQVPTNFQNLYNEVQQKLTGFNQQLNGMGAGTYPVAMASAFPNADADVGPGLVQPSHFLGLVLELQALHAMGVRSIMVELGFPILYEPFFKSHAQYVSFVNFYGNLASTIRQYNMTLIVENDTVPSEGPTANWHPGAFYQSLNWQQYQAARAQGAVTIAETMHPDYLVLVEEPDYEAQKTGQQMVNTPDGAASLARTMIAAVQNSGVTGVKLSAGVGTWLPYFADYINRFAALPLDTIDMHIYTVNAQNLPNAIKIAQLAAAAGKPISISESWLHKVSPGQQGALTEDDLRARDTYAFWEPLDTDFIYTLQNFGTHFQSTFLTLFEAHLFWSYLNYDNVKSLPAATVLHQVTQAAGTANKLAEYSGTGINFYKLLDPVPYKQPPTIPADVKGSSTAPGTAKLTWHFSTDLNNIGLAGYRILRNGAQVANTALLHYADTGLSSGQTYNYNIEAFDLAGNVSAPSKTVHVKVE
jgi:hypothetical protein